MDDISLLRTSLTTLPRYCEMRKHEDLDRLHKAQTTYTISILEFDPNLRTECERMVVREQRRRERCLKSRDKPQDQADRKKCAG